MLRSLIIAFLGVTAVLIIAYLGVAPTEKVSNATAAVKVNATVSDEAAGDANSSSPRQLFVSAVRPPAVRGAVQEATVKESWEEWKRPALATAVAAATVVASSLPTYAITAEERSQLSYLQVKGTGLANRCSTVKGEDSLKVSSGQKMVEMCLEPKAFFVEQTVSAKNGDVKTDFVATKLMTRQTYSLDGISGTFGKDGDKLTFKEEDGIDYSATTVQLPGGERVPFLFTVKELVAKASTGGDNLKPGYEFGGTFKVPSYRTGLFLDPKGRGMSTGYDMAQALPGLQSGGVEAGESAENNKVFDVLGGSIEFEVQNVNTAESEVSGVFVSAQPSDTDMGGKEPKKLLLKGSFYAKIE